MMPAIVTKIIFTLQLHFPGLTLVHMLTQKMSTLWVVLILVVVATIHDQIRVTESIDVGVCYGLNGNDLPSPTDVVALYKRYGIKRIRLFEPDSGVLEALRGSEIDVIVGVRNEHLQDIATNPGGAETWYTLNIIPYLRDISFSYITVGNEVVPGDEAQYVAPAMQNLQKYQNEKLISPGTKITTVVSHGVLGTSYPPSSGAFSAEAGPAMIDILHFLSEQGSPIMLNVYPYFAYASNPAEIPLQYALFTSSVPVVYDGDLSYYNLFDAMVDSFYAAMEKENINDVAVAVSESGWPSAGNGNFTTPELADVYNTHFRDHVTKNGTPRRPGSSIEGFIFAMFEENLKPAGVEQHWGLFYPNMEPVYPVFTPPTPKHNKLST